MAQFERLQGGKRPGEWLDLELMHTKPQNQKKNTAMER
jgi:hypothetical protein